MPFNNPAPNFALSCSFNAREWSGEAPISRLGTPMTSFPTFSDSQGIYEDAITFLNGRGSYFTGVATGSRDLASQLENQVSFGTDWKVELLSNDKISISNSTHNFKIWKSAGTDFLGVNGTLTSSLIGGREIVLLDNWIRGNCGAAYNIRDTATSNDYVWLSADNTVQDCIVYLRKRRYELDLDDTTSISEPSLESLDNAGSTRWYINSEGHVVSSYLTSVGDITWTNTDFRNRLGFDGGEAPAFVGFGYSVLTANNPIPCCLYPSRPIAESHYKVEQVAEAKRKIGGGYVSNFVGSYLQTQITYHLDALLDQVDLTRHFTDQFIKYASNGERVNYYQGVGDSRRSYSSLEAGTTDYNKLYTSEDNGYQGRVRGNLVSSNTYNLLYPSRLRRRIRIEQVLEHLDE